MGKASKAKQDRAAKIAQAGYGKKPINWFPIITTLVALVAIGTLAAVTIIGNQKAAEPAVAPTSNVTLPADITTVINNETGAVTIGDSKNVLEEYVDFGCPHCGAYNERFGEDVKGYVADGKISLSVHPLALLDNAFQGTKYSTRSANAFYCVAETAPNSVLSYMDNLFANQPNEGTEGLTDEELIKIAGNSDATAAESCITDGTYTDFVTQTTRTTAANDWLKGTPTIRLNGEVIDPNDMSSLIEAL
jgi:protein-disulfide isomerase